jgi:hypothetical protein
MFVPSGPRMHLHEQARQQPVSAAEPQHEPRHEPQHESTIPMLKLLPM